MDRVQTIYPRYLVPQPVAGFPGLTYRGFRDNSPYQGEDLVFESNAPEHFLARCSRKGVTNTGVCLLERRIGNADITFRFPRDWLPDWENVAKGSRPACCTIASGELTQKVWPARARP